MMRLSLCGHNFEICPDAPAWSAIEHELGASLLALAKKLLAGELLLDDMATIYFHIAYAADGEHAPSIDAIRRHMLQKGYGAAIEEMMEVFAMLLGDSEKETFGEMTEMMARFPDRATRPARSSTGP